MAEYRQGQYSAGGGDVHDDLQRSEGASSNDGADVDWANAKNGEKWASYGDGNEQEAGGFSREDHPDRETEREEVVCSNVNVVQKVVVEADSGNTTYDVKKGTTSLFLKLCLTAEMAGNEASATTQMLFTVPNLQLLGMPLNLVPLTPGCVGPTLLLLLPFLGWYSDRGNNPRHRKLAIGILSILLVTSGAVCVVVANVLHIQSYLQLVKEPIDNSSFPSPLPCNTTCHMMNFLQDVLDISEIEPSVMATNLTDTVNDLTSIPQTGTPFKAWLAMFGYVLMDLAFEVNHAFVKAWAIMCSSRSEHAAHLTLATFMSSVGGLLTSCVSVAEFESVLQFSDDLEGVGVAVRAIIVMAVVFILNLAGGALTIIVGLRQLNQMMKRGTWGAGNKENHEREAGEKRHVIQKVNSLKTLLLQDGESSNSSHEGSFSLETTKKYGSFSSDVGTEKPTAWVTSKSFLPSKQNPKGSDSGVEVRGHYKRELFLIYTSMYFSTATLITASGLITDYVGKAIYGGDPGAEPGSDSLRNFQTGVWYGSFGFIVYYTGYLAASLSHKRVRKLLGHRLQYSVVLLSVVVTMVTLALTARLEVFFVACFIAGVQRASYFNITFVVLNDTIQAQALRTGKPGSDKLGLAMAVASEMAILSYSTLYPCTIALEHATGVVSVPLWVCCACASIAMILFLLIKQV